MLKPSDGYHPNFFDKVSTAGRSNCNDRLKTIKDNLNLETRNKLLDIGCSGGYFSFGMAEAFNKIESYDIKQELIDDCRNIQLAQNVKNIDFYCGDFFESDYLENLNNYSNATLYLSTHHHVINTYGLQKASELLTNVFDMTDVLFFDMGQKNENRDGYPWWDKLPDLLGQSQLSWLLEYINNTVSPKCIEIIGSSRVHDINRFLLRIS